MRTPSLLARGTAGGLLAVSLVVGGASVAGAAEKPKDLESAKTECLAAIDQRLVTLDELNTRIAESEHLTEGDRSAISGEVSTTLGGLNVLRPEIEAATTAAQLRELCPKIVYDYRVYLLVVPTTNLVIGADSALAAGDAVAQADAQLTAAIAAAEANGGDPEQIAAALAAQAAMNDKAAQAVALAEPVPGQVIPLTPASINDGSGQPVIDGARGSLQQARDLLKGARTDLRAAIAALRQA